MNNKIIHQLKFGILPISFILFLSGCKKEDKTDKQIIASPELKIDQKLDQKVSNYLSITMGVKLDEIKFDKLKNSYLIRGHELNKDTVYAQYGRANEYKLNFEK